MQQHSKKDRSLFFLSVGKLAAAKKMKMKKKIFHSLPPLRRSGQVENSIPTRRLDGFNEKGSISCDPFNQFSSVVGDGNLFFSSSSSSIQTEN